MVRPSITIPDALDELVGELSRESYARDDVPDVSKAQIYRELIMSGALGLLGDAGFPDDLAADGGEDDDDVDVRELLGDVDDATITDVTLAALDRDGVDVETILPAHKLAKFRRDQVKDENWLDDVRGGFEGRVQDELVKRWKNGYRVDDLSSFASGLIMEARVLWPSDEHEERREEAIGYVEDTLDSLREAEEKTTHDPLDVDEALAAFEGVEDGEARENFEEVVEDARLRLPVQFGDDAIVDSLANEHGVTEDVARDALEQAREQRNGDSEDFESL